MPLRDSKLVRRLHIAKEQQSGGAAYGLPDNDGIPALSTLASDLLPVKVEAASLVTGGEIAMVSRTHQAGDFGLLASEADAPEGVLFRTGTVPVQTPVYSNPSPAGIFADLLSTPAALILSSCMIPRAAITTRTVAVSGAPADDNTFDVADATGLHIGQLLALDKNGVRSIALLTGLSGTTVKVLTPFHVAVEDGDTVRIGQAWDLTAHGDLGDSLVLPMSFGDGRQVGYGCRADQVVLQYVGNGQNNGNAKLELNATMKVGAILPDSGAAIADIIDSNVDVMKSQVLTPAGRKVAETARTHPTCSSAATQREDVAVSQPVTVAGEQVQIDSFTATLSFGMEPTGRSDAAIGHADLQPGAPAVSIEMILRTAPISASEVYAAVANYRAWNIPFTPTGAHGAGICMPAARCVSDPRLVEDGKTYHRYQITLELAPAYVEDIDAGGGNAGFKIALF